MVLTLKGSDEYGELARPFTLFCNIPANLRPIDRVDWIHDGVKIEVEKFERFRATHTNDHADLRIMALRKQDKGRYTVVLHGKDVKTECSVQLQFVQRTCDKQVREQFLSVKEVENGRSEAESDDVETVDDEEERKEIDEDETGQGNVVKPVYDFMLDNLYYHEHYYVEPAKSNENIVTDADAQDDAVEIGKRESFSSKQLRQLLARFPTDDVMIEYNQKLEAVVENTKKVVSKPISVDIQPTGLNSIGELVESLDGLANDFHHCEMPLAPAPPLESIDEVPQSVINRLKSNIKTYLSRQTTLRSARGMQFGLSPLEVLMLDKFRTHAIENLPKDNFETGRRRRDLFRKLATRMKGKVAVEILKGIQLLIENTDIVLVWDCCFLDQMQDPQHQSGVPFDVDHEYLQMVFKDFF